jgi:hypothetical protein
MIIVHAEHEIRDFDTWKTAFDRDPIRREQSGVRRYVIVRPVDDPHFVIMDFEFETEIAAREFQARCTSCGHHPPPHPPCGAGRRPGSSSR